MPKILRPNALFPESLVDLRGACNVCHSIVEIDKDDTPKPVRFLKPDGEVGAYEIPCPTCPETKIFVEALQDKELEDAARDNDARDFAAFAGEQAHLGRIWR